jgi:hypothetical protein
MKTSIPHSSPRHTHTHTRLARLAVACSALTVLGAIGIANAATEFPPPSTTTRFCEATVSKTTDGKVPPPIIFNQFNPCLTTPKKTSTKSTL